MTKRVFKYPIALDHGQHIEMPVKARVILFALQGGTMQLWMEVDPEAVVEVRTFGIYGTGHPIAEHCTHLGSLIDGSFVWHLYEEAS